MKKSEYHLGELRKAIESSLDRLNDETKSRPERLGGARYHMESAEHHLRQYEGALEEERLIGDEITVECLPEAP